MCDRRRGPRLVEQVEVVGDQHAQQGIGLGCMCDRRRAPRLVEQVEVVGDQHAHQRPRDARLVCAPSPRAFSRATTAQGDSNLPARSRIAHTGRQQRARREARQNEWPPVSSSTMVAREHSPAASVQRCSLSSCRIRLLHAHRSARGRAVSLTELARPAPPSSASADASPVCTCCSACRRCDTRHRQQTPGGAGQRVHSQHHGARGLRRRKRVPGAAAGAGAALPRRTPD